MLLTETHTIEHAGIILRIRLNARKFDDFKVLQQLLHAVVETDFLDAATAICQQDSLSDCAHHLREFHNNILAENQASRGHIIKVPHNFII